MILNIFSCAYLPCVCPLWRNVYSGLLPILELAVLRLLSIMGCLWILETNPLSITSFAHIFSQPVGCLFILLTVFFAGQKAFEFKKVLFFFVCFYFHYSWRWIKKDVAVIYVSECRTHTFWVQSACLSFIYISWFNRALVFSIFREDSVIFKNSKLKISEIQFFTSYLK